MKESKLELDSNVNPARADETQGKRANKSLADFGQWLFLANAVCQQVVEKKALIVHLGVVQCIKF